ncbi:SDR family NAD(P)-dependent oxidoreductase [Bacillus sp. JJ1562]|uniref:SDR family NAD(P)-dependent oxidoreductase n=1 Tax=Bacillus sp. JJ1562 TaxID=3122960 RepID=UPI0030037102
MFKEDYLQGKVALVTGGNRGIGRIIAINLTKAGATTIILGRDEYQNDLTLQELQQINTECMAVKADITSGESVKTALNTIREKLNHIDILVNCAGESGPNKSIINLTEQEWEETLKSNLTGPFIITKEVVSDMIKNKEGHIFFISAIGAKSGMPNRSPYSSAKSGLIGLARSLANELGAYNIKVNTIVPGTVEGDRINRIVEEQSKKNNIPFEKYKSLMARNSSLKRFVDAENIAAMIVLLSGSNGSTITGEDININAGAYFG